MAKDRPRYMTAEVREDVEYDDEQISAAKQLQIDTANKRLMLLVEDMVSMDSLPANWAAGFDKENKRWVYTDRHSGKMAYIHPLIEYYRGAVFMDSGGYRQLVKNMQAQPPEPEEVACMNDYFGIRSDEESYVQEVGQLACAAPLPPGWVEQPADDEGNITYKSSSSGEVLDEHPLDEYFRELRDRRRREIARRRLARLRAASAVVAFQKRKLADPLVDEWAKLQLSADRLAAAMADVKTANDPASIKSYNTVAPNSNCGWHEYMARSGGKQSSAARGRMSMSMRMSMTSSSTSLPGAEASHATSPTRMRSGRPSMFGHAGHLSATSGTAPACAPEGHVAPPGGTTSSSNSSGTPAVGAGDASAASALPRHMQSLREEASSTTSASGSGAGPGSGSSRVQAGGLASGAVRVDRSGSTDEAMASSMAPYGGTLLPLSGLLALQQFRDPESEASASPTFEPVGTDSDESLTERARHAMAQVQTTMDNAAEYITLLPANTPQILATLPATWMDVVWCMPPTWASRLRLSDWPGMLNWLPDDWVELLQSLPSDVTWHLSGLLPEALTCIPHMEKSTLNALVLLPASTQELLSQLSAIDRQALSQRSLDEVRTWLHSAPAPSAVQTAETQDAEVQVCMDTHDVEVQACLDHLEQEPAGAAMPVPELPPMVSSGCQAWPQMRHAEIQTDKRAKKEKKEVEHRPWDPRPVNWEYKARSYRLQDQDLTKYDSKTYAEAPDHRVYYHYAEGDMRFLQQRVVRAELETKKAGQELMQARKHAEEESRLLRSRASRAQDAVEAMRKEVGSLKQSLAQAKEAASTAMRLLQRSGSNASTLAAAQKATDTAQAAVAAATSAAAAAPEIAAFAPAPALSFAAALSNGPLPKAAKGVRALSHPGVGFSRLPTRPLDVTHPARTHADVERSRLGRSTDSGQALPLPGMPTTCHALPGMRSGSGRFEQSARADMPIRGGAIAAMVEEQRSAMGIRSLTHSVS